jgi:hypothetical protein
MRNHDDASKIRFMIKKMTHEAKRRQLNPAETILLNTLNRLLTDSGFAQSYLSHNLAALCYACNDPMWQNTEGD